MLSLDLQFSLLTILGIMTVLPASRIQVTREKNPQHIPDCSLISQKINLQFSRCCNFWHTGAQDLLRSVQVLNNIWLKPFALMIFLDVIHFTHLAHFLRCDPSINLLSRWKILTFPLSLSSTEHRRVRELTMKHPLSPWCKWRGQEKGQCVYTYQKIEPHQLMSQGNQIQRIDH